MKTSFVKLSNNLLGRVCLFFLFLAISHKLISQNLIQNGDFQSGLTPWIATSQYWNLATLSNSGCVSSLSQYVYHGNASGTWANSTYGSVYQEITIPANAISATLEFKLSINTEETTSTIINDILDVQLRGTSMQLFYTFGTFSNLDGRNASSCRPYQSISYSVPSQFFGQRIRVNFQGASNASLATVFRIDDVSFNVQTPPPSCVSWANGVLPANSEVVRAANYLCERGLIDNALNANQLDAFTIEDASLSTLLSLYNGIIPSTLPTNNYPTLFTDIDNLPFEYYVSIKALCFLDYEDGKPCIRRDFNQIYPLSPIENGFTLRMLLEAWNIQQDTTGWDPYKHSASNFACNIYYDDLNYGYYKKASQIGLLNGYLSNGCFSYPSKGEFFIVMLYRMLTLFSKPTISQFSYYTPNNFSINSGSLNTDVDRGVFHSFEQNGLSLPSGGLGIDFEYSYHSDWLDMPAIPNSIYTSGYELLKEIRAKQKTYPLGMGWTHSYNSFAHAVRDNMGNDVYFIFRWGNGDIYIYNPQTQKFETKGIYDELKPLEIIGGKIRVFQITTKDQLKYVFYRDGVSTSDQFILESITDRNGNRLFIEYESAVCSILPTNCINAIDRRVKKVTDNRANRSLTFEYQPNTDLIQKVTDNIGRAIVFYVNPRSHNLDSATNARGLTTKYLYCNYDSCANMLIQIQRPRGNWIKNTYSKRKLKQTQTPNYTTSINFNSDYTSINPSTNSVVQITPTDGVGYSTTYQHNNLGQMTSISSATDNKTIVYNDLNNPSLPTSVTDNLTGVVTTYEYDIKGNVLVSTIKGGTISQITKRTYNSNNDIVQTILPNGSIFYYTYNFSGNLITESGPLNYGNTYTRNLDGTINSKTNANGITTRFEYNTYGNPSKVTIDGTTIISEATYDSVSRVINVKDPNGSVSKYVYDANDNIVQSVIDTSELKLTTTYKFDGNDNCNLIIAPRGDSTRLTFDANDDLVREDYGNDNRIWGYYDDGSLKYYQDKNGHQFSRIYFPSGSGFEGLLQQKDGNAIEYYPISKLMKLTQRGMGKVTFNYDALNRITYTRFEYPFLSYIPEINYEYDISGFQTKIVISSVNKYYKYVPDALNRVSDVYDWNNTLLVHYTYRADGKLSTEQLGNGVLVQYHYDNVGRLDSIYAKKSDGTLLYSVGAILDGKGNHIQESYYVNKGSLSAITPTSNDPVVTYKYDNSNRIININSQPVTGDNAGNILTNGYSAFTNGVYDFWGHLLSGNVDEANFSFSYDPLGNRFHRDTILYIQDLINNGNVLAERKLSDPTVTRLYCHSSFGLVCSIDQITNQKRWYLYDFRGSTVAILDDNQNVVEYYKYCPFGSIEESSSVPGVLTKFLYVGKYGVEYQSPHLYYMRTRCYDPTNGRFYSEDPEWSCNLFVYSNNNPITKIDPGGNVSNSISNIFNIACIYSEYRYLGLGKRLDDDGSLSFCEARTIYKFGNGESQNVDIAKFNFKGVSAKMLQDNNGLINFDSFKNSFKTPNNALVYGSVSFNVNEHYVSPKSNDTYNFDMKPWKGNVMRNVGTILGKVVNGNGKKYQIQFYGSQYVK